MRAETRARIRVRCPLLLLEYNQNWKVSTNFSETSNIKFQEHPLGGSGV
jgi:hypothetical protein